MSDTKTQEYDETDAPTTVDGTDMSWVANKQKDAWRTPPDLYEPIAEAVDGIDLDPCAGPGAERLELPGDEEPHPELEPTTIGARNIYPWDDGLAAEWHGDAFVNPEFSNVGRWLATALGEWRAGNVDRVFFVTAANTGTLAWYHRWIVPNASVTFFTGPRQCYIDPTTNEIERGVSFNTGVHVFGDVPASLARYWRREGDLVTRPWNPGGIVDEAGESVGWSR